MCGFVASTYLTFHIAESYCGFKNTLIDYVTKLQIQPLNRVVIAMADKIVTLRFFKETDCVTFFYANLQRIF